MLARFPRHAFLATLCLVLAHSAAPSADDLYGDPLPDGALARFGTERLRHGGAPRALAFSPDGKTLASGGEDKVIRLWDVASGKALLRLPGHAATVTWLGFAADGKTLVSASNDGTIRVWDRAAGREVRALALPVAHLSALAVSADLKWLVFAGPQASILLWDLTTGKEVRKLAGRQGYLWHAAFSRDGKRLASRASGDAFIRLWDVATGAELRQIASERPNAARAADAGMFAFTPDGKLLASVSVQSPIRLWDTATGKEVRHTEKQPIGTSLLAFAPNGKFLVSGGTEWMVRLWSTDSRLALRHCTGHRSNITALAVSPDSKIIASGSLDQSVRLWAADTGAELFPFGGHQGSVTHAAFLAEGQRIATGGGDGQIRVWDGATGKEIDRAPGDQPRGGMRVSADAKAIVAEEYSSGILHFWQPGGRDEVRRMPLDGGARSSGLSPDGALLLIAETKTYKLRLVSTSNGKTVRVLTGHNGHVAQALFSLDSKVLITSSMDKTRRVWDLDTGAELRPLHAGSALRASDFLAISADGAMLAVADWEVPVRFWEVASGRPRFAYGKAQPRPTALAFSPDGLLLVDGGSDGSLTLRQLPAGALLARVQGHQGPVRALVFSADGTRLISTSTDGTALLWSVAALAKAVPPPRVDRKRDALYALWLELASADTGRAYHAIWGFVEDKNAVAFLEERFQGKPVDPKQIALLVVDLDSNEFPVRDRATRALAAMDEDAVPILQQMLKTQLRLEVRRRLEQLVERYKHLDVEATDLRQRRAVEALEIVASAEARGVLQILADGPPSTLRTRAAQAALKRLAKRPSASP